MHGGGSHSLEHHLRPDPGWRFRGGRCRRKFPSGRFVASLYCETWYGSSIGLLQFLPPWPDDHCALISEGALYPPASVASWMNLENEFVAGEKARILILPKDPFGNSISSITEEGSSSTFKLSSSQEGGSAADLLNFTYWGWDELGRLGIEFVPITAGSLALHVVSGNQSLTGSPLSFRVRPG